MQALRQVQVVYDCMKRIEFICADGSKIKGPGPVAVDFDTQTFADFYRDRLQAMGVISVMEYYDDGSQRWPRER